MKINYFFIALIFSLVCFAQVYSQGFRVFVSTTGSDTFTCGATTTPCRTFGGAYNVVEDGGSIIAIDSGIYKSQVSIGKSVTLMAAPGVHAELYDNILSVDRLIIHAGATGRVTLKNLYISNVPGSVSGRGISVLSVGTLQIENCVVDGFQNGLDVELTSSAQISIKDTIIRNNSGNGAIFFTTTGTVKVSIDSSHFDNTGTGASSELSGNGVWVADRAKVTIRDTVATGNQSAGFIANGSEASLNLDHCESANNASGVRASDFGGSNSGGTATVSNSIITQNSLYGFLVTGAGIIQSLGNNTVRRNATNVFGTLTVISGT